MEQSQAEFDWIVSKVGTVQSILEIGSREGASLLKWAMVLPKGAKIRSIDIGEIHHEWEGGRDPMPGLKATIAKLGDFGFDSGFIKADSHTKLARDWAKAQGPFDVVFIDGDHSYYGVLLDYQHYAPLGKIVVLHDIRNDCCPDVKAAWATIKEDLPGQIEEFSVPTQVSHQGVGLVRRAAAQQAAA